MKTRHFLILFLSVILIGCGKYDDTELWNKVNSNTDRIQKLEAKVSQMNDDIQSLQTLVNALQGGKTITGVRETSEGYMLSFSDGTSIELKHGSDGLDGYNGADAPIIGVDQYNGVYYWTVTINGKTDWLKDNKGNLIPTTGADGSNGAPGTPGSDGKDGNTPKISVDDSGYWIVSYDNGASWSRVLDVNGKPVAAKGEFDTNKSTIFSKISVYSNYVEFVLKNGQKFTVAIEKDFRIDFKQTEGFELPYEQAQVVIPFTVTGHDYTTSVELCVQGNLSTKLEYFNGKGEILVTRVGNIDASTKILVFLCNNRRTITYVLSFVPYEDPRLPQVVPPEIVEKMKNYMPIYEGVNPPLVEGGYLIDPMQILYDSNGSYLPGDEGFIPTYIRFKNQNTVNNTLDYEEKEGEEHVKTGNGAFISGSGDAFTAFFNTTGTSYGISVKTALVISGRWSNRGIKEICYAFVMVEKGADPQHKIMDVGEFRIFKDRDDLSAAVDWSFDDNSRSFILDKLSKFSVKLEK